MAPPKDVTEAIVDYKNAAEDWDIKYESYQEAVKDVKKVPKALLFHLYKINDFRALTECWVKSRKTKAVLSREKVK